MRANMSSPVFNGTFSALPFVSKYVDITHETIIITPNHTYTTAKFEIEYYISVSHAGQQIPLLFYASEFGSDFKVWLDGKSINLQYLPTSVKQFEGLSYEAFMSVYESGPSALPNGSLNISEFNDHSNISITTKDLKFFYTNLAKGNHIIRVEYNANRYTDRRYWVQESSFRYALSPAKYWKSFGTLQITLNNPNKNFLPITNLGNPALGSLATKAVWNFDKLPTDVFFIAYKPAIPQIAKLLIAISPIGVMIIVFILLALMHILAIRRYRTLKNSKYSWVVILGSIVIPFIALMSNIYAYKVIDATIGPNASGYHGYASIFILLLYPVIMPVYWFAMNLLDRNLKSKKQNLYK